jgi:hypothetical protein
MVEIVVEGVLFVALVVTAVALFAFTLVQFTPLGLRIRQTRNRRLIEQTVERTCPIHGPHAAADLVLLPSGERICPECFKEIVND